MPPLDSPPSASVDPDAEAAAPPTAQQADGPPSAVTGDHPSPVEPPVTRREWMKAALLAVLLLVAGAGVGFGVGALLPVRYAAQADVLYLVTREQPTGFLREDRNLSTQIVLISSRTVLGPVSAESGIPVEDLAEDLQATVVEESEVIRIRFLDTDPERATRILDSVVARYLAQSSNDERADVRGYLDEQLATVLERIDAARAGTAPGSELGPLVDREQELRGQLDELNLSDLAGPAARVLVPPYVETDPAGSRLLTGAAVGGSTALLVVALGTFYVVRRRYRPSGGSRDHHVTAPDSRQD